MDFKKTCECSALVLLIALAACSQSQKPGQRAPSASKSADSTTKSKPSADPARSLADTTAKTHVSPDSGQSPTDTVKTSHSHADLQTLTLPVLDALFYEPDFTKELKAKLRLSGAKIAQLRTAAHASIR